jgi:UDP-N-acetyl-alpha-D-muramoyl-L-alanyl-L-glutamate epimerase
LSKPPPPFEEFVFERYRYDPAANALFFYYRFAGGPRFEERLSFEFPCRSLAPAAASVADRVFRLVFLMSGVSYYKAYVPPALRCEAFSLDRETVAFLTRFYENGLAEFAWRNRHDLRGHCRFVADAAAPPPALPLDQPRKSLVPVGGGKDSIVTIECLRAGGDDLTLFALGDADPIAACIATSGLPFIRVQRRLDPKLLALNRAGALNGHVPITGILSAIALAAAVLAGFDAVVLSNEHSASAANLTVDGLAINHQFSKSLAFEADFADYVARAITPGLAYFSLLRPLSELEIARRFAQYPQYFPVFRSCNAAFRQQHSERGADWCGNCAKCRFVFLALASFVAKDRLISIFGRNLLDDNSQTPGFAELCGLSAHKPFECVGEVAESGAVMARLAGLPQWAGDSVVRRLHAEYPVLRNHPPGEFADLLSARHPHRVPRPFLRMLDAGV